jgi:hypothetical protein
MASRAAAGRRSVAIVPSEVPVAPNSPLKAADVLFRIDLAPSGVLRSSGGVDCRGLRRQRYLNLSFK